MAAALLQPIHIDAVNKNGDTALHAAALLGYDRVVKLLADKGATPIVFGEGVGGVEAEAKRRHAANIAARDGAKA